MKIVRGKKAVIGDLVILIGKLLLAVIVIVVLWHVFDSMLDFKAPDAQTYANRNFNAMSDLIGELSDEEPGTLMTIRNFRYAQDYYLKYEDPAKTLTLYKDSIPMSGINVSIPILMENCNGEVIFLNLKDQMLLRIVGVVDYYSKDTTVRCYLSGETDEQRHIQCFFDGLQCTSCRGSYVCTTEKICEDLNGVLDTNRACSSERAQISDGFCCDVEWE